MLRFIYFIAGILLAYSVSSYAADYAWTNSGGSFSSPSAACLAAATGSYGAGYSVSLSSVTINDLRATCKVSIYRAADNYTFSDTFSSTRSGDSCPASAVYNPSTGVCDPPQSKCSAKKDTVVKSFHWLSSTDEPSSTISIDGCAAAISGVTICKTASPSVYSCTGTATWSGETLEGAAGSGNECTGAECTKDDPQDGTKNDPCIKQDTGAGFTCTSKVEDSKAGETSCGTANGVYVCTAKTIPSKTTVTNQIDQIQSANPDGSYTTKNVTTTTKTTCVADKCTETKYTTTTKGGTTGQGDSIPPTTECTGKDCPSQTGSGGTGGGQPDDGKGDKAGTSQDCKKPPECEGDTFMCAVLKQNALDSCLARAAPTIKEASDRDASIKKQVDEVQASQDKLDSDVTGLLSGFKAAATSGGSGAVCYPDKEFQVYGHTIVMPFTKVCDPLLLLRYAVIAGAYLLAARILTREV